MIVSGRSHATKSYDAGTEKDMNFIAMQLIGDSLASLCRSCPIEPGHFPRPITLHLSLQCVEAIRDLHYISVLHHDIKPVRKVNPFPMKFLFQTIPKS